MHRTVLFSIILTFMLAITSCHSDKGKNGTSGRSYSNAERQALEVRNLEYLTPILLRTQGLDTGICLIATTDNDSRARGTTRNRPYTNSVQIIDAGQPWPPRWYSSTPVYPDEVFRRDTDMGYCRFDFIQDVRIVGGYFSFFKILGRPPIVPNGMDSPEIAAYMLLNDKMEAVDTVQSNTAARNLYFHDLSINSKGERLTSVKKDTYLDLRDYSGNQADRSVHCGIDILEILDSKDSVVFAWNPLYHIDPQLFDFKSTLSNRAFGFGNSEGIIQWTRLTSVQWDYDGDILYSMKNLGIGKFSRTDGHLIWQINRKQMPLISGKDTIEWYNQHDFKFLYETDSSAVYSLYSDGLKDDKTKVITSPSCGILFELNKKTYKVKVLHYQRPQSKLAPKGQGGYDYSRNGDYILSYGVLLDPISPGTEFTDEFELGHKGNVYVYQVPQRVTCYKVHRLENFPAPPRPSVVRNGNELQAVGDMQDYTWYQLSGPDYTTVDRVGSGRNFKFDKGGTYCVAGKYGIGYSVSKPFIVSGN